MVSTRSAPPATHAIWDAVDGWIDSIDDLATLEANRLQLLAARRWRALGREVPDELEASERGAALVTLVAPVLLKRVRDAIQTPLVLHKGPEVAARYPDPALRSYSDLDVLVRNVRTAQKALVAAGFVEIGNPVRYEGGPHALPLTWPGYPLVVELHDRPNWPSWLGEPPTEELLEASEPSSLDIDGVLTLAPPHHALIVAMHSWRHGPMARIGDLVDVAVMTYGLDDDDVRVPAERWGLERLWWTTSRASEAVLFGAPEPWALRTWARNLRTGRERTVLEAHIGWWLAGFSAVDVRRGLEVMKTQIASNLVPAEGETWGAKLRRTRRALRNARATKSHYDAELERAGGDR